MKYVNARCEKCDLSFKIDLGALPVDEVRIRLAVQDTFECPGHHVELSGPLNYWEVDWDDVRDDGKPILTDEAWIAQYDDMYEHVVDSIAFEQLVDKIKGFAMGMCRVTRNGVEELISFSTAPSGKRYYLVGPKQAPIIVHGSSQT